MPYIGGTGHQAGIPGLDDLLIEHPAILEPDVAEESTIAVSFLDIQFDGDMITCPYNRFDVLNELINSRQTKKRSDPPNSPPGYPLFFRSAAGQGKKKWDYAGRSVVFQSELTINVNCG